MQRQIIRRLLQRVIDDPRPRHADIQHRLGFAYAMKRAGHERVVFHGVGKADKLCASHSPTIAGAFRGFLDQTSDPRHRIHVDAGARGGGVNRSAEALSR